MKIKELIQNDKITAMKDGNKKLNTLLGTLLGELDRVGKNPSNEDCLRVIKKMVENSRLCNNEEDAKQLEIYLPQMFSETELEKIIQSYCQSNNITEKKQMGLVMSYLKTNYTGLYDGKTASGIIQKSLK